MKGQSQPCGPGYAEIPPHLAPEGSAHSRSAGTLGSSETPASAHLQVFSVGLPSAASSLVHPTLSSQTSQGPDWLDLLNLLSTQQQPLVHSPISWYILIVSTSETWHLLFRLECLPSAIERSCFRYHLLKRCSCPPCLLRAHPVSLAP